MDCPFKNIVDLEGNSKKYPEKMFLEVNKKRTNQHTLCWDS